MLLYKKIFRNLKKQKLGLIGALALVLSGSLVYVTMEASLVLTELSMEQTLEDYGMADISILTFGSNPDILGQIEALPDVEIAEGRYDMSGIVELDGERRLSADLFGLNSTHELVTGRYLQEDDNLTVLAEWNFAEAQNVSVNDKLSLEVLDSTVEVTVVGIVWSIEYILPSTNFRQLIPQRGSSAPLFMDYLNLSTLSGQSGMINEISVIFEEGADKGDATEQVLNAFSSEEVYYTFRGYDLVDEMEGMQELYVGRDMTPVMALIVLAASAVVVYVVVRRVIEEQSSHLVF